MRFIAIILSFTAVLLLYYTILLFLRHREPLSAQALQFKDHLVGLFITAFCLVMLQQSKWQFFGHLNGDFANTQAKLDRRPMAKKIKYFRGRIYDRNMEPIVDEEMTTDGSIHRYYRLHQAAAHITGYDHPIYDKAGLEGVFDDYLMGRSLGGLAEIIRFVRNGIFKEPVRGNDLVLTIDSRLQLFCYDMLDKRKGAIVVLNPINGELLACVSYPSFDPQKINKAYFESLKNDPDAPLLNRALQGLYPPGSIFKIVTAAAALETGLTPKYKCEAQGYLPKGGGLYIRDHEYYEAQRKGTTWNGHGLIGMNEAMERSSNSYFARLGEELGANKLYKTATSFGFNHRFTLFEGELKDDLMSIATSELPTDLDKEPGSLARTAIGQYKVLATPLHLALVISSIANGGKILRPTIIKDQEVEYLAKGITPSIADRIGIMLKNVVNRGTGIHAKTRRIPIAGKTSTAENPRGKDHAWFVCYAPANEPTVAVCIIIENAGYGGTVAAPLAKEIIFKAEELGLL